MNMKQCKTVVLTMQKITCLLKYLKSYLMVMKYNFKCYARRKRDKTIEEYKIFNRSRMM